MKYRDEDLDALKKAANAGDAKALVELGNYWYDGDDLFGADYTEAVRCYRAAEALGNPDADFFLAKCYRYGEGVAEDEALADELYRKAVDADSPEAIKELAWDYIHGFSTSLKDREYIKIGLAKVAQSDDDAKLQLAEFYLQKCDYHPELAEECAKSALATNEYAAKKLLQIAVIYRVGDGVPASPEKAIKIYEYLLDVQTPKGATNEFEEYREEARVQLGLCYTEECGVPTDFCEAAKHFRVAHEHGNSEATLTLGKILFYGKPGVPANPEEGANLLWCFYQKSHRRDIVSEILTQYYRTCAERGNAEAQYRYSELLKEDCDYNLFSKEKAQAYLKRESAKWLRLAAEHGYRHAQYQLYSVLSEVSPQEAVEWLKKAAENNQPNAIEDLARDYWFGDKKMGIRKNLRKALALYEKLYTKKFPDCESVHSTNPSDFARGRLAWIHYELREWENAAHYWKEWCDEELKQLPHESCYVPFLYLAKKCSARGRGMPKDPVETARLLRLAAKFWDGGSPFNNDNAFTEYADVLWKGKGVARDRKKAVYLYKEESCTNAYARLRLAWAYFLGEGIDRDFSQAFHYFRDGIACYYYIAWGEVVNFFGKFFKKKKK